MQDAKEQSLNTLIKRLREQAASEEAQCSVQAVMANLAVQWRKRLKPLCEPQPPTLFEPRAPRLAELLCAHRDADTFVERAYWHLLGREHDEEGGAYYRKCVSLQGRLHALITLAQAEEAQRYCQQCHIAIPLSLLRLQRWQQRFMQLRQPGARLWQAFLNWLWERQAPRWREQGQHYESLARARHFPDELYLVTSTLLDMVDALEHLRLNAPNNDGA
ncbi:hypothetical protein QC823_08665 [Halomonas vilamensis]|uniref:Uncharacterized protein n=1 Tax=Vreelandella vilamensis TaxID=531309 RepID=A0ABU1H444_9GAMM|nr:hypothetical protein [Halomonas vilamensis]MDR5899059.1 hypothetical protein [Halomonas vilamensis]